MQISAPAGCFASVAAQRLIAFACGANNCVSAWRGARSRRAESVAGVNSAARCMRSFRKARGAMPGAAAVFTRFVFALSFAAPTVLSAARAGDIEFTLFDADTDAEIGVIVDNVTIDPGEFSGGTGGNYAIEVYYTPGGAASYKFYIDSVFIRTENSPPYVSFGDGANYDYFGNPLPSGAFTVRVEAYSASGGTGTVLADETLNLTVSAAQQTPVDINGGVYDIAAPSDLGSSSTVYTSAINRWGATGVDLDNGIFPDISQTGAMTTQAYVSYSGSMPSGAVDGGLAALLALATPDFTLAFRMSSMRGLDDDNVRDWIWARDAGDIIDGRRGDDVINGGQGDDQLTGGLGDDSINGGGGYDTAVFSGVYSDYEVEYDSANARYLVSNPITLEEDILAAIENVSFLGGGADMTPADWEAAVNSPAPVFSISSLFVDEDEGVITFSVTRAGVASFTHVLSYHTQDGSGADGAVAGNDYTAVTNGSLSFAPADPDIKTFDIAILNDGNPENDETFTVVLTGVTNGAAISSTQGIGTATIKDDDTGPAQPQTISYEYDDLGRLKRADYAELEANVIYAYDPAGNRKNVTTGDVPPAVISVSSDTKPEGQSLSFTVSRSGELSSAATVDYATSDGTAVAGADYSVNSDTLLFAANEISKTVEVLTTDDIVYEDNETVTLTLSNPSSSAIIDSTAGAATGTINDNDSGPVFSIDNPSVSEGGDLVFTVTKSGGTSKSHNVAYASQNITATAGVDYGAVSGILPFTATQPSKTITVSTIDEALIEGSETMRITLSSPTNGAAISPSQGSGVGTITNDDANVPPVANNDAVSMDWNSTVYFDPRGNDTDINGQSLTITSATESSDDIVSVSIQGGTQLVIVSGPSGGFQFGGGTITYTISDGAGGSDTATVAVSIH